MSKIFDYNEKDYNIPRDVFVNSYFGVMEANVIQQEIYFESKKFKNNFLDIFEDDIFNILNSNRSRLSILHVVISWFVFEVVEEDFKLFFEESSLEQTKVELSRCLGLEINDDALKVFNEENYIEQGIILIKANKNSIYNKTINSTFQVLFNDRIFLQTFNIVLSSWLRTKLEKDNSLIKADRIKNGKIKRKDFSDWIKNAVYFRDRGFCSMCQKEVLPLGSITKIKEYTNKKDDLPEFDHIVPIANWGTNDISNIQLSCRKCNRTKSDNNCDSSDLHVPFYNYIDDYSVEIEKLTKIK